MPYNVVIDDDDLGIRYSNTWSRSKGPALKTVGVSESIGNTIHYASGKTSPLLTYSFTGSAITVYAIMTPEMINNATFPYNWRCYVDDIPTAPMTMLKLNVPGTIKICHKDGLKNEQHQLIFNFFDTNNQILFDYLEYTPPPSAMAISYNYIGITADSANVTYSGDWFDTVDSDGVFARQTERPGDFAEFQFNGSSISLVGYTSEGRPGTTASYSIDGQNPTIFSVPTYMSPLNDILPAQGSGQLLFQTQSLNLRTQHTLHVEYNGQPNSTYPSPLGITTIIIGNGTIPASSSTKNTPTGVNTHKYRPTVVGAVAGFVAATFIVAAYLYMRRRRKRNIQELPLAQPFEPAPGGPPHQGTVNYPSRTDRKDRAQAPISESLTTHPPASENRVRVAETAGQLASNTINVPDTLDQPPSSIVSQEEDSGLRNIQDSSNGGAEIVTLPPMYTAA